MEDRVLLSARVEQLLANDIVARTSATPDFSYDQQAWANAIGASPLALLVSYSDGPPGSTDEAFYRGPGDASSDAVRDAGMAGLVLLAARAGLYGTHYFCFGAASEDALIAHLSTLLASIP